MWHRFTERARQSVFRAQRQAQWLQSGEVTTATLLLGILSIQGSIAFIVLQHLGVDINALRDEVEKQIQPEKADSIQETVLSRRFKLVVEFAYEEAKAINNRFIGTEHLLLGLIREREGPVALVLSDFGVTLEAARLKVQELQDKQGNAPRTNWSDSAIMEIRAVHPLFRDGSKYPLTSKLFLSILNDSDAAAVAMIDTKRARIGDLKSEVIRLLLNK